MAQSYNLGALGQFLTVNSTSNTAIFANVVSVGNSTVNTTINSSSFSGTSNNALYLGSSLAANYVQNTDSRTLSGNINFTGTNSYFSGKTTHAANLVLNAGISLIDSTASQGTAGQFLTSNGAGNVYWSTIPSTVVNTSGNFTVAGNLNFTGTNNYFSTAVFVGANSVVNTTTHYVGNTTVNTNIVAGTITISGITINSTIYNGTANNASYLGTIAAANYVQNTDSRTLSGNLNFTGANNVFGTMYTVGAVPGAVANSVSANTTTILFGNNSVNSTINSTVYTGTANNASYLGTVLAANYIQNTDTRVLSGNLNFTGTNTYFSGKATHAANIVIGAGISVIDSTASQGIAGQVLTSNGAGNVYWSTFVGVNTAAQYTWTNTHSFTNTVTLTAVSANGSLGATNQVLTSNGSVTYWSSPAAASVDVTAQYTWTNTHTFTNTVTHSGAIVSTNTVSANGGVGTAGQVLTSGGSGANVYWSTVSGGGGGSFTNGASIAVSNLAYTSTTGTSVGVAYSFINTTSNSIDTVFA